MMAESCANSNSITLASKPHQPRNFRFPRREFGKKTIIQRAFQPSWFDRFAWLHYDEARDAAFCHICCSASTQKRLKTSHKESTFLLRGFTNWKDGTVCFSKHEMSDCHKEAVQAMIVRPQTVRDVGEQLSEIHASDKMENRKMLLKILQNLRFLARQCISVRGDNDETESNFCQLLMLRGEDDSNVLRWMEKKANKYTSAVIQNELLEIMALSVLRKISSRISSSSFYSIMADECTDVSNKEQLVLCFRWVDEDLSVYEYFVGLYQVPDITSATLVSVIKDTLLRMNLSISSCRGQCFDGASNMAGIRGGVSQQILEEESRALFIHCYGHSLNLAASDAIKGCKVMSDALDTTLEVSKLIKFSPKREGIFENIKKQLAPDSPGLRVLCPTRWTVRGESLHSVVNNYGVLQEEWDHCLQTRLQPDVRSRIIGVQSQMKKFDYLFGVLLGEKILKHTDNLSRTLQHKELSAAEAQTIAGLSVQALQAMRNKDSFQLLWELAQHTASQFDVQEPTLPRKRKAPQCYEVGTAVAEFPDSYASYYQRIYF